MRLTSLSFSGLKGRAGDHVLAAPVTLFAGPNGAGKTTRLLAIQAGLDGRPGTAASADGARATLQFDTGLGVQRQWTRKPGGGLKQEATAIGGPSGVRRVDAWVAERIGLPGQVGDLLSLTPTARELALLDLVDTIGPDIPTSAAAARAELPASVALLLDGSAEDWSAGDCARWLADSIGRCKSERSALRKRAKAAEHAIRDLALVDDETPPGTLPEAHERAAALRARKAELGGRLQTLEKLGGSVAAMSERAAEIDVALTAARQRVDEVGKSGTTECVSCGRELPASRDARREEMAAERTVDRLEIRREEIGAALAAIPPTIDPALVRVELESMEIELNYAIAAVDDLTRAAARNEERARWLRQRVETDRALDEVAAASDQLAAWRRGVMSDALTDLAAAANTTIEPVLGTSFAAVATDKGMGLELHDRSPPSHVYPHGDRRVPLSSWSDSETVVCGVGAHIALAARRGVPWSAVLIDEVQRLDPARLARFVHVLGMLAGTGGLGNALIAGAITEQHREELAPLIAEGLVEVVEI